MILWHIGGAIFLFRWIFRDPKVELRLLALGALAPDIIDFIAGLTLGEPTRQRWGHALLTPTVVATAILLSTRRGRRRRNFMTVVVAWMFHLLLDGVWIRQETFLWPFFGTDFAPWPTGNLIERARSDPWRWFKELIGLGYLVMLWRRWGRRPGMAPG